MNTERLAALRQACERGTISQAEIAELFEAVVPTTNDCDAMQRMIGEWARETFHGHPIDRARGVVHHLEKEVQELLASVRMVRELAAPGEVLLALKSEAADCLILLLNLAYFMDFSLFDAAQEKHAVNMGRTWQPPDALGVCEHVKEEA